MVIERGEVWWADLGLPDGSEPGGRRPILIVQSEPFNRSRLRTVLALILTTNLRLVEAPGNVLIPAALSALPRDSVANVSQLITLDRDFLLERASQLPGPTIKSVDAGLRLVLGL